MNEETLPIIIRCLVWIVRQSGILGAVAGFVAAALLAWPAILELRDRREWETLSDVRRRVTSKAKKASIAATTATPATPAKINQIQWDFLERRMGQFYSQRRFVVAGFVLLVLSFVLTLVEKVAAAVA